jgi:peptidoglycan hydrolase-like amidase
VIAAFYHSSSGGRTADAGEGFDLPPRPWLRAVGDPFDRISPNHRWTGPSLTGARIARMLRLGSPVRGIALRRHRPDGRVATAVLVTADGRRHRVGGPDLRISLGLRSTWLFVARRTD